MKFQIAKFFYNLAKKDRKSLYSDQLVVSKDYAKPSTSAVKLPAKVIDNLQKLQDSSDKSTLTTEVDVIPATQDSPSTSKWNASSKNDKDSSSKYKKKKYDEEMPVKVVNKHLKVVKKTSAGFVSSPSIMKKKESNRAFSFASFKYKGR
jgi:hypothetical protein